ncbi:uncharacterized protein HMPREF1541_08188 [Cyphellophora europaea CBS 101466]|uniref:FAD/NAD(P)-binding domain-containing protein n=1 Tax=Cyphellophora europaea (strain CBS 101466) TaxID=1220924 RepID=W2RNB6_CYPE1|nr:uncharacterized protein HMPREF1541_08188 [Cyphellophora europaea CBS 101466]ETN37198.1 hypothetical protein HMPREF1541_08188 [Cyphellophora europaea CBS 101466]
MLTRVYDAVVAGGGAAGIATVGALLHFKPQLNVAWVDPDFRGGRISKKYRDVSSNTKVRLFADYANALEPFQQIIRSTPKPNAMTVMAELDQNRGCQLHYAADMLQMLTGGLWKMTNVDAYFGRLSSVNRPDSLWSARLNLNSGAISSSNSAAAIGTSTIGALRAHRLIVCTGSSPTTLALPTTKPETLDLDDCLDRQALRDLLPTDKDITIGIIGTSHSAIVLIMNLYELATSTHPRLKMRWFVRSELTYAQEMDGWILRDNTGLKGASADFAREHLEENSLKDSPVRPYLAKVDCPDAADPKMKPELEKCTHIVQAIGFSRSDTMPKVSVDGKEVQGLGWNPETGALTDGKGAGLPQAFGAGIAFPERVKGPHGNVEHAVGMWKFMRYLKRTVPTWVE